MLNREELRRPVHLLHSTEEDEPEANSEDDQRLSLTLTIGHPGRRAGSSKRYTIIGCNGGRGHSLALSKRRQGLLAARRAAPEPYPKALDLSQAPVGAALEAHDWALSFRAGSAHGAIIAGERAVSVDAPVAQVDRATVS